MRRSTVLNLRKLHGIEFCIKNRLTVLLCLLFVTGVAIGVFTCRDNGAVVSMSQKIITRFFDARYDTSFFGIFLHSLMGAFTVMLAVFLCGGSLMGFVTVPLAVATVGFIYGAVAARVCMQFALKGVAFNAIILIPPCLIFFVCLLTAARHSFTFSTQIAKMTLPSGMPSGLFLPFKDYSVKFCVNLFFCIFSALADAILSSALIGFFDF